MDKDDIKALSSLYLSFLGVALSMGKSEEDRYPYERLGDGYELRPIELKDKNGDLIPNTSSYSHLYLNGEKVSDNVFRKGGLGGKFKDGYCELIHYTRKEKVKDFKKDGIFDYGSFVIIDGGGEIKFRGKSGYDHPHHIGGHLAKLGDYLYDLRTGLAIAPISSNRSIYGKNYVIIEHCYDWYNKEVVLPLGVYKIDFKTAEVIKIDDIKK